MDSIGAEVGQKMRSAIKAKLMELNCYVDDELPDYIMVMVANKRTKSQMNEDLSLFLNTRTATFVDWLHIVLKKLKEVTVTNPDVYKKTAKRKSGDLPTNLKVKKEKKDKKGKKDDEADANVNNLSAAVVDGDEPKSLTDDLPINANKLAEQRKIVVMNEHRISSNFMNDNFDIPLLSEVNMSSEKELQDIEKKIRNVKSRLGLLVSSDTEEQEFLNIKTVKEELFLDKEKDEQRKSRSRIVQVEEERVTPEKNPMSDAENAEKRSEHKRITFNSNESDTSPTKKLSIMERLGKRHSNDLLTDPKAQKTKINLSEYRKSEENFFRKSKETKRNEANNKRDWRSRKEDNSRSRKPLIREKKKEMQEGILRRLGVMSKVSVPKKDFEEPEEEFKIREVPSVVKIKPRVIPADAKQANKNLLLKAMADAHRSIAQTPNVGNHLKPDALYTKKYKDKSKEERLSTRKLSDAEKTKLKNLIAPVPPKEREVTQYFSDSEDMEDEYIPKPVKRSSQETTPKYVPSTRKSDDYENGIKHQFVITLDGIERTKFKKPEDLGGKISIKSRLDGKRTPSPIVFDKLSEKVVKSKSLLNIPDKLPIVQPPLSIKNKERCKYWPGCRQGDKCEFVHPMTNCEVFPHCKFGEKCLYIHPSCKFGSSCTKRDCPYSHTFMQKAVASRVMPPTLPIKLASQALQTCKFFPSCTNINCLFYHPKPCKFGKYCKNLTDCNFSHAFAPTKSSLTWRSKQ